MEYNENPKDYYPPMHTAEHLLNGTMDKMFGRGRSFSAHIEKKKSKCDYHFDRNLTEQEIQSIEEKINSVISEDLPVREEFMKREDAEKIFNLSRLPEEAGETLRVINIGDYDKCLCSGTHLASTKSIGGFKIISTNFENGVLRIRFKIAEIK
ncbi:MAG: alanyl-tRNA editing protein [Melioribacteraceae bacterium]